MKGTMDRGPDGAAVGREVCTVSMADKAGKPTTQCAEHGWGLTHGAGQGPQRGAQPTVIRGKVGEAAAATGANTRKNRLCVVGALAFVRESPGPGGPRPWLRRESFYLEKGGGPGPFQGPSTP